MPLPQWQSLDQIIGDMSINFVSRLDQANIVPNLQDLKPGSPFLAIFQAIGQSRMRNQQQMMEVLDANNIDSPSADLDRIGNKENIPRLGQTFSRGLIDIGDSSFQKITSKLYHGVAAPIPGTIVLYVTDASLFPVSGTLYIGRGTTNFEGPLNYISTANLGINWSITLASGTLNFHALTEVVTLAQGGDRTVSAGQSVRTPAGGSTAAITFVTTQTVVIADGEDLLINVPVICQTPGQVGNVPKGAIKDTSAAAFTGMTATNSTGIQNGRDSETDTDYRARIKATKASRELGTKTAIETFATGVDSPDESSIVTTASLIRRHLRTTILTIDDGSGYEEKTEGINYEVVVDSANGGETTFSLTYGRPVAKAFSTTILLAPYVLQTGSILAVEVGGVHTEHAFLTSDFRNISNATAYEIVASINANASLPFSARTINSGNQTVIFAKDESQDSIQVTVPFAGIDANQFLNFPTDKFDTLRLYKDDRLLQKDGQNAVLVSQAQGSWSSMSSGETLIVNLDGTGSITYTINDVDFSNAGTGFSSVSATNTLTAWAAVLNAKLPGITTTVNGSFLELMSNKGLSVSASIILDPTSTLVVKGMFSPIELSSYGRSFDFLLDRNLGQIELVVPLLPGERLTAGTPYTRAYIESEVLAVSVTIPAGGANTWFFVDGDAQTISTGLSGAVYLSPTTVGGDPNVKITALSVVTFAPVAGVFSNLEVGDWYIQTAASAPLSIQGVWRVSEIDAAGTWFKVELAWATYTLADSTSTAFSYITFARASTAPQQIFIPAGTYTPAQLAALVVPAGATAVVMANRIRISTNTFSIAGDIALVAQDYNSGQLQLSLGLITNNPPHIASVQSGNNQVGTPNFRIQKVNSLAGSTMTAGGAVFSDYKEGLIDQLLFIRPPIAAPATSRISTLNPTHVPLDSITSTSVFDVTIDSSLLITDADFTGQSDYIEGISLYRFGPESYLNITLNQDLIGGGFAVPIFRRLIADPTVPYGVTLRLKDSDLLISALPSTLDNAFGTSFDFSNFALHLRARGETHPADVTKKIFWRKSSFVGATTTGAVKYIAPTAPAQNVSLSQEEPYGIIDVNLPSGADRAIVLSPGKRLYYASGQVAVLSAYNISSITRAGGTTVTATLTAPFSVTPGAGMPAPTIVWVDITSPNFTSGAKTITLTGVNTITWIEVGANVTEAPIGATVSWAANPVDFTAVQVGDYTSGWVNYFASSGSHVMSVSGISQYGIKLVSATGFVTGMQTVAANNDFTVYPVCQSISGTTADLTATILATQVNTLAGIATGTVTGTGVGIITQGYPDDANATALLQDGILHIKSGAWNAGVGNYDLTLKFSPLLGSIDYSNELFRLVPTTTKNITDFLGRSAVTGLTLGGGDLEQSDNSERVQISSTTLGTGGAIQVTGGNANSLRLSVVGAASAISGYMKIPVRISADLATVPTMCWVSINTNQTVPKRLDWTTATSLQFYNSGSKIKVAIAGTAWAHTASTITAGRWYVEKHGRFVGYTVQGAPGQLAGLNAGDWVVLSTGTASLINLGTFRVIWTAGNTFWIDNAEAIPEDATIGKARFFTYDSVMAGDIFQVGTSAFSAANQGLWTVTTNDDEIGNDTGTFFVSGVLTNNGPTVVSTNLAFLRVMPSTPTTSFGRIRNFITDPNNANVSNLYLDYINTARPELVSLPTGAVVQTLDRLEFPTNIITGQDAYSHDIGLISAVNQILYGDESDPDTYPGVIAVGDDVFIQPPLIRRVFISVAVREVSGSNTISAVQAAIAKVINSAGGKPVPISSYISEAQAVPGVISVIPLSPIPTEGADTIPVQPGEKAAILDIDNDIQISIIGS